MPPHDHPHSDEPAEGTLVEWRARAQAMQTPEDQIMLFLTPIRSVIQLPTGRTAVVAA